MNKKEFREKQLKYWRRRNAELSKVVDAEADEVIKNMRRAYDDAARHIDQQLAHWYQQFADNNDISFSEAKRMLDNDEVSYFRMTLEEYIQHGEQLDVDPDWLAAMINASSMHHVDRLTALKMTTQAELEEAIAKIDGTWMERMAKDAYLHALYATQHNIGVGFNAPNIEMVMRAARKPWTPDGMEFVERKNVNNAKLVQKVMRELTQAAITGESYGKIADRVRKDIALTQYESERIIRTEAAHIETEASMQSYKDCGIDRYQVIGTYDKKMCELCAEMDMTVWKVSQREDGLNAPPFHPNCRCTTVAYFDDLELQATKAVRNAEGKTVFVPESMTYEEWVEQFASPPTFDDYDITEGGKYTMLPRNMSQFAYSKYIQPILKAQEYGPDNPTGMTKAEYKQIWDKRNGYIQVSPSYKLINDSWRNPKTALPLTEERKKTRDIMERLTSEFSLPTDFIGFRKVDSSYLAEFLDIDVTGTGRGFDFRSKDSAQAAVDAINAKLAEEPLSIPDDAVTSVSMVEGLNYFKMRPVLMEVQMPKGTKGLMTDNFMESEFIAENGSNIEIIGATSYNYKGRTYLRLFARMTQ